MKARLDRSRAYCLGLLKSARQPLIFLYDPPS
jgi:hypothetical protein